MCGSGGCLCGVVAAGIRVSGGADAGTACGSWCSAEPRAGRGRRLAMRGARRCGCLVVAVVWEVGLREVLLSAADVGASSSAGRFVAVDGGLVGAGAG
jgi:hypothetical protein